MFSQFVNNIKHKFQVMNKLTIALLSFFLVVVLNVLYYLLKQIMSPDIIVCFILIPLLASSITLFIRIIKEELP